MMDVPLPRNRRRKATSGPSETLVDAPDDDSALRPTGIRFDVARAHQRTIALRNGNWEFMETPELKQARREIRPL
jgi:hypothetical protein